MSKKEPIFPGVMLVLGVYMAASFFNGKLYNDCKKRLERNNTIIEYVEKYGSKTNAFSDENSKLVETITKARKSPLYYPCGLLYDMIRNF